MSVNERDYIPQIDPPFIQDTRDNIDSPNSKTVLSNGHQVTSNAKENSTMSRINSTARKIFNNLSFILELAVGLTLVGTAIAIFVALSPKLLAVALVVGVIGLIVILGPSIFREIKKNEELTKAKTEAVLKNNTESEIAIPLNRLIHKFNKALENFSNYQYLVFFDDENLTINDKKNLFESKQKELNEIKKEIETFSKSIVKTQEQYVKELESFREKIVTAIIGPYPEFKDQGFLGILDVNSAKIEKIRGWLVLHSYEAFNENFVDYKNALIWDIFEIMSNNPDQISSKDLDVLLQSYDDELDRQL